MRSEGDKDGINSDSHAINDFVGKSIRTTRAV